MNIYKATIQVDIFVEAPNEEEAERLIFSHAIEEVDSCDELAVLCPSGLSVVNDIHQVPIDYRSSIAWGSQGNQTIQQTLETKP